MFEFLSLLICGIVIMTVYKVLSVEDKPFYVETKWLRIGIAFLIGIAWPGFLILSIAYVSAPYLSKWLIDCYESYAKIK